MKILKKQQKVLKAKRKPIEAVKNMETIIKSNKGNMFGLPNKNKYLKNSKRMKTLSIWLKNLGLANPPYYSKISFVKFANKYQKLKTSSLFLHFLKNNFKIIEELCHENASEFK